MTIAQKIILIALLAVGALGLLVGFVLIHHIGGFLRTVEEEALEQEQAGESDGPGEVDGSGRNSEET